MRFHYFAYGSNMDPDRRRARGLSMRALGLARLPGYRFAFEKRGDDGSAKANVHEDAHAHVWGVVFACSEDDLERLDRFEGATCGHYRRTTLEVVDEQGNTLEAVTYIAEPARIDASLTPSAEYLEAVLRGARAHGLPPEAIAAIEHAAEETD